MKSFNIQHPYIMTLREVAYISIIICHYSKTDDFGEEKAKKFGVGSRSEMLRICLDSLEKNTDCPAEIIVIDNGGDPDDSNYLLDKVRSGLINTYVRNKNNMNFGWAWNQGIMLATSEYILLTCNDIEFFPNWLSQTFQGLKNHPHEKFIAAPFVSPDKTKGKSPRGILADGYRINAMAGSNCMLMTKRNYWEIGAMTTHQIAGSHWHRRMNELGYLVIVPPQDLAQELAFRAGTSIKYKITVKEDLLGGTVADFSYPYTK